MLDVRFMEQRMADFPPRPSPTLAWCGRIALAVVFGVALLGADDAAAATKAFADAVQQYRAGHLSDAFGRFFALANEGDADAARIALFMHQYGPTLYGRYWDAPPQDVARWQLLQDRRGVHQEPRFQPDWLDPRTFQPGKQRVRAYRNVAQ